MLQPQAKTGKTGNLRGSVNDLEAELEKGLSMADALSRASLNKEILDLKSAVKRSSTKNLMAGIKERSRGSDDEGIEDSAQSTRTSRAEGDAGAALRSSLPGSATTTTAVAAAEEDASDLSASSPANFSRRDVPHSLGAEMTVTPVRTSGAAAASVATPAATPGAKAAKLLAMPLSPRGGIAGDELTSNDGAILFGLPKLCKFFSSQNRPLSLLVKLIRELPDPTVGVPASKKLVGLSRLTTFTEKDCLHWLVQRKFTAAASSAARLVELLQRDYVISEVKKGIYRFMADDERQKARFEEEKAIELKVQKKLMELAKQQKKDKGGKQGPIYQVIGVELDALMAQQRVEYPTLDVPFLLVRFAADVIALNGQKEEGIFRLSVGTEEVAQMVHQINSANDYTLVRRDPNVAAVMMKRFLRDLPRPLCSDYDGAIRAARIKADDAVLWAIFEAQPMANQNVMRFLANFIAKMTRPEVVAATRMDTNNYAIVFTPGVLRSQSVDISAMANQSFEQDFTTRLMVMLQQRYPDDTVGTLEAVPKPVTPAAPDRRVLLAAEGEMVLSPEELVKKAEERLKNAQRDLREAKEKEQKEQKVTLRKGGGKTEATTSTVPLISSLGRAKGKEAGSSLRLTTETAATPTRPSAGSMSGGSPSSSSSSPSRPLAVSTSGTPDSGAGDKPASPPRPRREAPKRGAAPDLPPLPPMVDNK